MKLRDIFLLPKDFYRRLTDSRLTLYIGILLVGIRNIGFYLWSRREDFAGAGIMDVLVENLAVVLAFVVLIGIIDVVFFSYPVFDLLKLMKRREEDSTIQTSVIRLMKVYIIANLIVTPVDLLLTYFVSAYDLKTMNYFAGLALAVLAFVSFFWYFAVIGRGAAALFRFKNTALMFGVIFIIALMYNHVLNYAYTFIYEKGLMTLMK